MSDAKAIALVEQRLDAFAALGEYGLKMESNPAQMYRGLEGIGVGASGRVFRAYTVGTNALVAIKMLPLEKTKIGKILNEIMVLRTSRHESIVGHIDDYLWKGYVWIIMDYVAGGTLTDVVASEMVSMTEGQISIVCKEV